MNMRQFLDRAIEREVTRSSFDNLARLDRVRRQIDTGTYLDAAKLDATTEKLRDELFGKSPLPFGPDLSRYGEEAQIDVEPLY